MVNEVREMAHRERYFLRANYATEWTEVTQEQFVEAEQAAGFHPKPGCGPVATGGFHGRGMAGSVRYEEVNELSSPTTDGE